jgi:hypothetical protein
MKELLKGTVRTSIAIFGALIGLTIVIAAYSAVKDSYAKQQLKPLEQMQPWHSDLAKSLGLDANARTKLIDGNMMVSVQMLGYPRYLLNPINANAALIFEFLDKDGFKIVSKPVQLTEFTTNVDDQGHKTGLSYQFKEPMTADRYQQLGQMQVLWTFVTEVAPQLPQIAPAKPMQDHCEPNLSKAERLKRLAQHGKLRETGSGNYEAGGHSLDFFNAELLGCR